MGNVSDRSIARVFMALGLSCSALIMIFMGTVPYATSSVTIMFVLLLVNGWFQGMGWPPSGRVMVHWFSSNERGTKMAIWNVAHNIGGGMVGLAFANLLAQSRHRDTLRITIIDAGERPEYHNGQEVSLRVSAIAGGSADILQQSGAWDHIIGERACPYREMKVWDAAGSVDGSETLTFGAAEFAVAELGFIVENGLIQHALLQQLELQDVAIEY